MLFNILTTKFLKWSTLVELKQPHTSVTAGKIGLYGAGTGIDKSYMDGGPKMSLELTRSKWLR